jgi:DNA-binding beta-propeller fold protein YncE
VNSVTNQLYVSNPGLGTLTGIDLATKSSFSVSVGTTPDALIINLSTNEVYVANSGSNNVSVVTPAPANPTASTGIATTITPLVGNVTFSATPTFNFQATSLFGSGAPPIEAILYQVDTTTGPWQVLTPIENGASATLTSLRRGTHTLFAYAIDGLDSTSINPAGSSIIGRSSAYAFVYGELP